MNIDDLLHTPLRDLNVEMFKRRDFDFITTINTDGELEFKHLKQEEALLALTDNISTEIVYGGAAGGAKSWTGCSWIALSAMAYPGTKWFIGREELGRLKDTTLLTFHRVCKEYSIEKDVDYRYLESGHCILFANGSRIDLLELKYYPFKDPLFERFGSLEYTGGWIEEGGEVHFGAFDTLKSRIGRIGNDEHSLLRKLFVTCNPKKNWLYTMFYKPFKNAVLKIGQKFISALVIDNPFIESGYLESLNSISDLARRERLKFGNWDYDDDPAALMTYVSISDLYNNKHIKYTGIRYITADIARQGEDSTRIYVWDGYVNIARVELKKAGSDVVTDTIRKLADQYKVPMSRVVVDADGVGGPVADHLKCEEFLNNSTAFNNENYANKRSQCYFKLAELVNSASLLIEDCGTEEQEQINLELAVIKKKDIDSDGKDDIISRKDIKALIGCSPDHATNFMLRMYFEYFKPIKRPKYTLIK